jgi:exopolysaccharide biosynthesis polyprenyl glycosylphosphotransferase
MRSSNRLRKVTLPMTLLVGDALVAFAGLSAGYGLRYATALGRLGIEVPNAQFEAYLPLLLLGVGFLLVAYGHFNLYDEKLLLRKYQSMGIIIKGTAVWFAAYLGLSLVLKFSPPISRLFVTIAFLTTLAFMFAWRSAFYTFVNRPGLRESIQQRALVLGWNEDARSLVAEVESQPAHPYYISGVVPLPGDTEPPAAAGRYEDLGTILTRDAIDVLIAVRLDLPRTELQQLAHLCEQAYVELKVVPSAFQIFLSGLRLQTVGRLPVLGVENLPISLLLNRIIKRLTDVTGAVVGLLLSSPIIAILAALIKRESPSGPVFFKQIRVGANHRSFPLYKLRSMSPDAASQDHAAISTCTNDPRLLHIGAFMRRWNLDELPQFWNVLCGEMSLVGPRPERPYHVDQLATIIPHYLPRHLVKPGMTGWAQVNRLRGESDIGKRIQHDIYYIENWSPWLDAQILLLTFARWKNTAP